MTIYRIKNWNALYETSRSRQLKTAMAWVPIRTKQDGGGYAAVMAHERGAEIYTAWILMLQIAAKCEPRGCLVSNGTALNATLLALQTRGKAEWFQLAFGVLSSQQIGWIERINVDTEWLLSGYSSDVEWMRHRHSDRHSGIATVQNSTEHNNKGVFTPPSLEAIKAEAGRIQMSESEAENFFNHFTANGWLVGGKAKMKSWTHALKNWKTRSEKCNARQRSNTDRNSGTFNNPDDYS